MKKIPVSWWFLLLWACCLSGPAWADGKIRPWMMADWQDPAPHLADLGLSPRDLALKIGKRLVILPHPERNITIPGESGPREYTHARFVSAVARVDLPVQTLRRRLLDFSGYKNLFPMLTQSEVMKQDGKNIVARYRIEVPLPAIGSFTVDFRIKHVLEADGSISAMLIDGKSESLVAMLGGMTDELSQQPVLARWEFLPVDEQHSLLVFTYWDRVELKSFFARKLMEAYPEMKVVGPYLVAGGAAESIHRLFTLAQPVNGEQAPQSLESLEKMQSLMEHFSAYGTVAVMEPEQSVATRQAVTPLRYVSIATRIHEPPAITRAWCTKYDRLPEAIKELQMNEISDHGHQVDLDLTIKFAVLLIRFSIDMDVQNTWISPQRLEFRRTKGELAQLWGASEWY